MAGETKTLAEFATALRYQDIPAPVIAITKACLIDAVAVALFGSSLPWGKSVAGFSRHVGGKGSSTILSPVLDRVSAPAAALANGTFAHSFEFDNLRQPSVGVHPGSTASLAALAVAEEFAVSGRDLITALVAGNECMLRTGLAAKSTSEHFGFHAPGLTGVFGSAIAASRIMGNDAHETTMAIGIGGSFGSGLLAFAKAGNGGMVKRLHMGRAAEGGVTAAYLAARGFEGPDVVLEGKFGYLDVYAEGGDPALLVEGLGTRWDSLNIWFKMFPCHVTAQAPVRAVQQLQREHKFSADDVARIVLAASDKVLSHHADRAPSDVGTAQYSVPFSVALALFRDPADPQAFLDGPNQNPKILELCRAIELRRYETAIAAGHNATCRLEITLKDGRILSVDKSDGDDRDASASVEPLVEKKFFNLTSGLPASRPMELLARLKAIEDWNIAKLFSFTAA
ncbi:MAG TPA: MmgE/PrpD family protein [Xanthobacteraceae bacterium]|jgi:2-methylcitrate dehydratase PrpD|nr:MmgE/PrpD family protein [Xanthobacteraceae bacterium]